MCIYIYIYIYIYTRVYAILELRELSQYNGWGTSWAKRVRFPAGADCFQTGSGAHPVSCPMGTRGSFPGDEADHSSLVQRLRMHGIVLPRFYTFSWRVA
jgi:hypothetical protein